MDKHETIVAVMEAFDEAERLRNEVWNLERDVKLLKGLADTGGTQPFAAEFYRYGRNAIWERYGARQYYDTSVRTFEEGGTQRVEGFDEWAKRIYDDRPDFMSRDEFMLEFDREINDMYETERRKALGD